MWRRCRPPDAKKLKFSFSTLDLTHLVGAVYVIYVPGSEMVLVAGARLNVPERPRGSDDRDSKWKGWSHVRKRVGSHPEWWTADSLPPTLPRPKREPSILYTPRTPKVRGVICESIPPLDYAEQPEIVRKFWRNVTARLFNLVDPLVLLPEEYYAIAGYSQAWLPVAWGHFGGVEQFPAPVKDLFNKLFALAKECRADKTLPIPSRNLTEINIFTNSLFARLSHRYGFLELSTNHLLTFAIADKIVESVWNGTDVELTQEDVKSALRYWLSANLARYNIPIQMTPTERELHIYHIAQQFQLVDCRLETTVVLADDCDFLLRDGYVDPNYIRVSPSTTLTMSAIAVPALPVVAQNRRICAFLYSLIHNDSFLAQFPLCVMPTTVRVGGHTYALSALVNLSIERLEKSF